MTVNLMSLRLIALHGCTLVERDVVQIGPFGYRVIGWDYVNRALKLEPAPDYDKEPAPPLD